MEFDDRPGPVRDALAGSVEVWMQALRRAVAQARDEGHLRSDVDAPQLAFEIHGLILALHYEARFLHSEQALPRARMGFERLVQAHRADQPVSTP